MMATAAVPQLMRNRETGELVAFALITAMGLFLVTTAGDYTIIREGGIVGGGFLPLLIGVVLTVLGSAQLVTAAIRVRALASDSAELDRRDAVRRQEAQTRDAFGRTARQRTRQFALVLAATVVAVATASLLGLLAALGLLSVFISAFVERRSWWASIVISVASVGLVWLIFVPLLGVPLPDGLIIDAIRGQ
ncbi:MAG TPA: tripartite tricarboxylate transporter TctB family protein [Microbacterium sp.]|nr:tripartite tricarboxylate transporter TctB family protein [Microbacterium sp.]